MFRMACNDTVLGMLTVPGGRPRASLSGFKNHYRGRCWIVFINVMRQCGPGVPSSNDDDVALLGQFRRAAVRVQWVKFCPPERKRMVWHGAWAMTCHCLLCSC